VLALKGGLVPTRFEVINRPGIGGIDVHAQRPYPADVKLADPTLCSSLQRLSLLQSCSPLDFLGIP